MKTRRPPAAVSAWIPACAAALVAAVALAGEPPRLEGIPTERAALGNAFVEAWLAFRRDLDAVPHAGVNPALIDAWFSAMPRFLARDAARLAAHPAISLAAARRIAPGARGEDRALLAALERRYEGSAIAPDFRAQRLVAADEAALSETLAALASPEPMVALEGARSLAAAGDPRGLAHLRRSLERGDGSAGPSARVLGAYGAQGDVARLETARARGVDAAAVDVGLGELALRRDFPLQNAMIAIRDPSGRRFDTIGGLYDAWLSAVGRAASQGARDAKALFAHVDRERAAAQGYDGEPLRRYLQSFIDFWADVDLDSRATPASLEWPGEFGEAVRRLHSADPDGTPPSRFARRFGAAIAVLAAAGPLLDYPRLAAPTEGLRFLSAGGDRAADGSFATSFRGGVGAALSMDIAPEHPVRRLWVAVGCPDSETAAVAELRVSGVAGGKAWKIDRRGVGRTRYFEEIPLGAPRAGRIDIAVVATGDRAVCLSEIRAE